MSQQLSRLCECVQVPFVISTTPVSFSFYAEAQWWQVSITGSFFYTAAGTVGTTTYESFIKTVAGAISIQETANTYSTSFNPRVGVFDLYTDAPGFIMRVKNDGISPLLFGLTGGASHSPAALNLTGSFGPYYVWRSSYSGRSKWKKPYEPRGFYTDAVADDGTTYSIGKEGSEVLSSWRWEFEPENHVRRESARALEPWTYQHLIEYARSTLPLMIHTSSITAPVWDNKEGIYKFRGEASNFAPQNQDPNFQTWLHLDCQMRVSATGSNNGSF